MADVTIKFTLSNGYEELETFEANSGLILDIEDYIDDYVDNLNSELEEGEEEVTCDGWEVDDYCVDYADQQGPEDFNDLDDWGEYCEDCDEFGNAYCLRYADVGENNFQDEYVGCFDSFLEFATDYINNNYNLDNFVKNYFDYDSFANDLSMEYSSYDDRDGCHIFRD